jgi:hypothetical protein
MTKADLGQQVWRWAARDLAADTPMVLVAAALGIPRPALEATLELDAGFGELIAAYRAIEELGWEERAALLRARLLRAVEQMLETGALRGLGWAFRALGLIEGRRPAASQGATPAAGASAPEQGPRRTPRFQALHDAVPDFETFYAGLDEAGREALDRATFRPEFINPDHGLLVTDPQLPEDEAVAWLLFSRGEIQAGRMRLTDAVPRPENQEPTTGRSLADPALAEDLALAQLRVVRAQNHAAYEAWLASLEEVMAPKPGSPPRQKPHDPFRDRGWAPPNPYPPSWRTPDLDARVQHHCPTPPSHEPPPPPDPEPPLRRTPEPYRPQPTPDPAAPPPSWPPVYTPLNRPIRRSAYLAQQGPLPDPIPR